MKRKRFTEEQIISILREREAGMKVADLNRKHGVSEQLSSKRCSADFMSYQLVNGRRFRALSWVDDFSRKGGGQIADTSISGSRFARYQDQFSARLPDAVSRTTA